MKLVKTSLFFCLAALLTSSIFANGTDCQVVAKPVKYVKPDIKGFDKYFNVRFGTYTVMVPPGFDKVATMMNSGVIVITYPNNALLMISSNTLSQDSRFKGVDTTQYPNILYTKTSCDKPPTDKAHLDLWNLAMTNKALLFTDSTQMMVTKSDQLTYYISDNQVDDLLGDAHVVDKDLKNDYLLMTARGFTYTEFRNIVLNITNWK